MTIRSRHSLVVIVALATAMTAFMFVKSSAQTTSSPSIKSRAIDPILESGSPDGKWAIYRREETPRKVVLRELATGTDRELVTFPDRQWTWAWSPDSREIAFGVADPDAGGPVVHVVSIPSGADKRLESRGDVLGWTTSRELLISSFQPGTAADPATSILTLASPAGSGSRILSRETGRPQAAAVGVFPGGDSLLMRARAQDRLFIRDIATGIDRDLARMPGIENPAIALDGTSVAFTSGKAVYVASVTAGATAKPVPLTDMSTTGDQVRMWWLQDGSLAVSHAAQGIENLYRVDTDAASGRPRGPARLALRNADYPAISPDSKRIAHTFNTGGGLGIAPASGGADEVVITEPRFAQVYGWRSPSVIFGIAEPLTAVTIDVNTRARSAHYDGRNAFETDHYSPSRDESFFAKRVGGVKTTLVAYSLRTATQRTIVEAPNLGSFTTSPDGRWLAYSRRQPQESGGASELHIRSLESQEDRVAMQSPSNGLSPMTWSHNGRYLLYSHGWDVRLLNVASGQTSMFLPALDHPRWIGQARWAPDGSFVIIGGETEWKYPVGKVFEKIAAQTTPAPVAPSAPSTSARTRVTLLGTGTPVADPDRFGPAVAITVDDQVYLVDAGVGVVRRAAAAGITANRLTRVFLTHLHSDHTVGLPDLMLSPWVLNRPAPLVVYGPAGTRVMAEHIEAAWREDIAMRTYGMEPRHTGADAYRAVVHEIKPGRVYEDAKVKVDAIAVPHGTWPAAFGYRFETPDRVIVISGDTKPTAALAEACNGCDVLIHEVYSATRGRTRAPEWQAYDSAYHTSTTELAVIAKAARPRLLVLYHTAAAGADLEREVAQAGYTGRVVAGKDLDVY